MIDIEAIRKLGIQEIQHTLPDVVESVQRTGEPCIITRDGENIAVVARHAEFFFLMGVFLMHEKKEQEPPDISVS